MKARVADVMTEKVLSVRQEAGFKEMVAIMESARISALPVVDEEGHVVGVVSEADLLLKEERPDLDGRRLFESRQRRIERRKAAGQTAGELMSSPPIVATPDMPVVEAARIMHRHNVKRLPVVDPPGRLVGIVSRADVLKVFMRPDEDIRREIVDEVIVKTLWMDPERIRVTVVGGIVELAGEVDRKSDVTTLVSLCSSVDGVVAVDADLRYRFDDSRRVEAGIASLD